MNPRWEYKIVDLAAFSEKQLLKELDKLGQEGWQLGGVLGSKGIFMRKGLKAPTPPAADFGLSPREFQVYELLGQGLTNMQISAALGLEGRGVSSVVNNIFKKMKVDNRKQVKQVFEDRAASKAALEASLKSQTRKSKAKVN